MPGTVKKKRLTIKTTAPTVAGAATGEEGDASQQAAPAQSAGAPVPPPPVAAAPAGGNYKVSAILAIIALVLFGALIAIGAASTADAVFDNTRPSAAVMKNTTVSMNIGPESPANSCSVCQV